MFEDGRWRDRGREGLHNREGVLVSMRGGAQKGVYELRSEQSSAIGVTKVFPINEQARLGRCPSMIS